MKLGTKILLGFVGSSLIYVAIFVFVVINLLEVQDETKILKNGVMPGKNTVGSVENSLAKQGLLVTQYG
ncbi:MAG: hypothetical protein LBJ61_05370, partial [Deltaproteobacteria bacterium]|nr:hypothetical protein [Deltaproteobacteria bacterium]